MRGLSSIDLHFLHFLTKLDNEVKTKVKVSTEKKLEVFLDKVGAEDAWEKG